MGQLEDMQAFVRVIKAGGISTAAEQMGLAKSAVSRRLADLETRLGVRLLNRTTRKSSLTEAGRLYFERAARVIDDVTELNAMTTSADASLEGTLRLAAPLSFGLCHLAPAIDLFARSHGGLTLHLDFSDRQIDLVEEGFDLAVRIAELGDSTLKARRLAPIRMVLCASPAYLQQQGIPQSPWELGDHQGLRYKSDAGTSTWKLTDREGKEHVANIATRMIANNGDFLRDMAIAGHGIAALPTFIVWQAIATGELVTVMGDYTLPQRHAYAVYPQTRYLSQRARLLIDFLAERFGEHPYWDQHLTG